MSASDLFDTTKFVNSSQIGGIDAYTIDQGAGHGARALCVNTGAGLRYRILADRGLDIDQAFFNQHSLTYITHKGLTPPTRGLDRGPDWLKSFGGGLLTSCGPFNVGKGVTDNGDELGLHGPHSNTAATLEGISQPDLRAGKRDMSVTGLVKYGQMYGPCVELRRTIRSTIGVNRIEITDEFFNAGNQQVPHAWLLHVNFGYPLMDEGGEFCYDAQKVAPMGTPTSRERFKPGADYKKIPAPMNSHKGNESFVGYLYPKPSRNGQATVAIINRKLALAVAIHYSTKEFPRCANWQHFGPHEYVCALEPANCGVEGRDVDRQRGWLDHLPAGGRKSYTYSIEVIGTKADVEGLRKLNK